MNYTLQGIGVNWQVELSEEDIIKIIKNGLKISVEKHDITNFQSILLEHLIEMDKIKITLEKIGKIIPINKDILKQYKLPKDSRKTN